MWMPTVGMSLYALALFHAGVMPEMMLRYGFILAGCTFFITALVPLMWIAFLVFTRQADNFYLDRPEQRKMPYLITTVAYGSWAYLLYATFHVPGYILCSVIGATIALAAVTLITSKWKISAHTTGIGGLLGGVLGYYFSTGNMESVTPIVVLMLLSLVVMYARLYLDKHTSGQVVAGWILGIGCTLIPVLLFG